MKKSQRYPPLHQQCRRWWHQQRLRLCVHYPPCNAPTGGVRPDIGKGVRLLGKSTGSYGKPETTRVSLVRRWTSKLGRCLTRQSKRSCSEAMTEKAISDKPLTGLRTRGSTRNNKVEYGRDERGSLRRDCDTLA